MVMRREQTRAMLNCRVLRGAELETDHYLLVSSCKLQLSQPRAVQRQPRRGYDSELMHDAALQRDYASMITDEFRHFYDTNKLPDRHT